MKLSTKTIKLFLAALAAAAFSGPAQAQFIPKNVIAGLDSSKIYQNGVNIGIGTKLGAHPLDVVGNINTSTYFSIGGAKMLSYAPAGMAVYVGPNTGTAITTGFANTFMGNNSGSSTTSGSGNAFYGNSTGRLNTTGTYNTFLGNVAGGLNTSGSANTFVGSRAGGTNSTGANNTFMGYSAGANNTTGNANIFMGVNAGSANTTGFNNVMTGNDAGTANTSGFGNVMSGFSSGVKNTTGYRNVFMGIKSGYSNTTGYYNTFVGDSAGVNNATGHDNTFIGHGAGNNVVGGALTNATGIGANVVVTNSNTLILGSNANVGIGTSAPAFTLHVNGTAGKPGGGAWSVASDRRLKKDISNFTDGLEIIKQIKPVWFRYTGEGGLPTDEKYVGIIAQEMQKIAPYTVGKFNVQDKDGKKSEFLNYDPNALWYIIINGIKEQQAQIEEKSSQITALETKYNALAEEMAAIKKALADNNIAAKQTEPAKITPSGSVEQNEPNPCTESTSIRYFIPETVKSASIYLQSADGLTSRSYKLIGTGNGSMKMDATQLPKGTYFYQLVTDGAKQNSRSMIILH